MKQLFFLVTLSCIAFIANSQLNKGMWLNGGSGSFYSYNETATTPSSNVTSKYTSIELSASIGYFVVDKLVLGLSPSYSYYKGNSNTGFIVFKPTKYAIGPFVRYYLLNTDKPYNILADVRYQFGLNVNPSVPTRDKGTTNNFSIMAGPEIFFNETAGLEILLGYSAKKETINNPVVGNSDTRTGFQVSVGFQIHLEKF